MTRRYELDLPLPVSVNKLYSLANRRRGGSVVRSAKYVAWLEQADKLWMTQKIRLRPIVPLGRFSAVITYDQNRGYKQMDLDNLTKCVLDFCQKRAGLILNDKYLESLNCSWAQTAFGCHVTLEGEVSNDR